MRIPSEQSSASTESMKYLNTTSSKVLCLNDLASICQARSPESSNISLESGYSSNHLAHEMHHSLSLSNMERK